MTRTRLGPAVWPVPNEPIVGASRVSSIAGGPPLTTAEDFRADLDVLTEIARALGRSRTAETAR